MTMKLVTDDQTVKDVEFDRILEWCSGFALSPKTEKRILRCLPSKNYERVEEQLDQVQELKMIRELDTGFPVLDFQDLEQELKFLKLKNSVIPLLGILKIHQASTLINDILSFFDFTNKRYSVLPEVFGDTYKTQEIVDPIEKVIDANGKIKDSASDDLKTIRASIISTKRKIQRNFEKELRRLAKTNLLSETRETVINNRRVLSVKSSYKKEFSGTMLGSSKTGSIVHIEPAINIELNLELDHLRIQEENEIRRILKELTAILASHHWLISAYDRSLHELDFINSKYRLAREMGAKKPRLTKAKRIEVEEAVHPILKKKNDSEKKKTFGQKVKLNTKQRMLVISGPNAGGKSITLKTLGLFQMMVQSGMFVPAKDDNAFYLFHHIYSEIGDNQSIENELSTYSYRLRRMKKFLNVANSETLLLMDEFGTGSDPDLGGALAEAFFEELYKKKVFSILTTHYSNIKSKAIELPEAINGCMLFNPQNLKPLFEFKMGSPGSSFTFEVAKINGVPNELIKNAKKKLDHEKLKFNELLSDLQKKTNRLEQRIKQNTEEAVKFKQKSEEIERSRTKLKSKYDKVNHTAQVQESEILAGKKMLEFIGKYKTTRGKKVNEELIKELTAYLKEQKTKEEVKRKAQNPRKKLTKKQVKSYKQNKIEIGSTVKIIATRQLAQVEEIQGKQATLIIGNNRIKVALDKLIWVK